MLLMPRKIVGFYVNGFRSMTLGKTLWKIILIKLIIIFVVIRLFFMPDYLNTRFKTDSERAQHVMNVITRVHVPGGKNLIP